MPGTWFNAGKLEVLAGTINLTTDTVKVMFLGPSYVFNAAHTLVSDLGAVEVSGTGYTGGFGGAGRKTLASKTFAKDNVNNRATFDAADLTWTAINVGTISCAVLVKEITDDAHSKLIAYVDVTDYLTTGVDSSITWDVTGILWMT